MNFYKSALLTTLTILFAFSDRAVPQTCSCVGNVVTVGTTTYPYTSAGLQAAINAVCVNGVPGTVFLSTPTTGIPITGFSTQISLTSSNSYCTIQGPGRNLLALQAAAGYTGGADLFLINGATSVRLEGFTLDGNRAHNNSVPGFSGLQIQGTASQIKLTDIGISNFGPGNSVPPSGSNCLLIGGDSNTQSFITVENGEFANCGVSTTNSGGGGIVVDSDSGQNILIQTNLVHGNTVGGIVYAPTNTSSADINISWINNKFYANAADGLVPGYGQTGGSILNELVAHNTSDCNGYNGSPVTGYCLSLYGAGLLQTGTSSSSPSGVGINVNSPLISHLRMIGNQASYNYWDGIDSTEQILTTVTTSNTGNKVTNTGTTPFPLPPCWTVGLPVDIGGNFYQIATISSSTSLTLTSPPGNHSTNVSFLGPSCSGNTIDGNISHDNGAGNLQATVGQGFGDIGIGDTWTGNIAYNNAGLGFYDQAAYELSRHGDKARNNDRVSGGFTAGFLCQGCVESTYDVDATDTQSSHTQTIGVYTTNGSLNNIVYMNSLCGSESVPILDQSGTTRVVGREKCPTTYANLPTVSSIMRGELATINDASTNTWGATVSSGGGSDIVLIQWNGSSWTVVGK
jgi:hypothetical protein